MSQNKMKTAAGALGLYGLANWNQLKNPNYLKPYQPPTAEQYGLGARLSPSYRPTVPMQAGGVVEQMSNANAIGQNTGYPQSGITQGAYSTPWQTPVSRNVLEGASDTAVDPITGQMKFAAGGVTGSGNLDLHIPIDLGGGTSGSGSPMNAFQSANSGPQAAFSGYNNDSSNILNDTFVGTKAFSGNTQEGLNSLFSMLGGKAMASGGIASLGSYSDGGRLLKGPGDGMSDSIPASIGNKQPARLGDGEFVVPADVVSHLGNGSTDAGAKQLYKMMDKVRQARTGRKSQGKQINPRKYMPA
jgi:hypothetical protein